MTDYVWVKTAEGRWRYKPRKDVTDTDVLDEPSSKPIGVKVGVTGNKVFSEKERYYLSLQTGRKIRTMADLHRYCRENGSRVVERGDHVADAVEKIDVTYGDEVRKKQRDAEEGGRVPFVS